MDKPTTVNLWLTLYFSHSTAEPGAFGMDWSDQEEPTKSASKKEYDCVICNQTTPNSEDKAIGLVVLVQVTWLTLFVHVLSRQLIRYVISWWKICIQATSVISHERQQSDRLLLPTSDEDPPIPKGDTRSAHFENRISEMNRDFDTVSCSFRANLVAKMKQVMKREIIYFSCLGYCR